VLVCSSGGMDLEAYCSVAVLLLLSLFDGHMYLSASIRLRLRIGRFALMSNQISLLTRQALVLGDLRMKHMWKKHAFIAICEIEWYHVQD
jgi:hypothetical protein